MKKFIIASLSSGAAFLPVFVFAQQPQTVNTLLQTIQGIFNVLVPVLVALATIIVIVQAIRFAMSEGEDKVHNKESMIKAIIALFILVSIWGLVAVLNNTFGIQQGTAPGGQFTQPCFDANGLPIPC
ncbi:MAG: pilin [Candidatus Pacebacteria bacterium]|nr:pilin [Candidatus Paceibacterota bacterium]